MGFLDIFFGKKKEEQVEEVIEEEKQPEITTHGGVICEYCKEEVKDYDKRKKFDKKTYHVKCFRKLKKDAKKYAFG